MQRWHVCYTASAYLHCAWQNFCCCTTQWVPLSTSFPNFQLCSSLLRSLRRNSRLSVQIFCQTYSVWYPEGRSFCSPCHSAGVSSDIADNAQSLHVHSWFSRCSIPHRVAGTHACSYLELPCTRHQRGWLYLLIERRHYCFAKWKCALCAQLTFAVVCWTGLWTVTATH